jgi:cation diffusion facilitator family transporter
MFCGCALFVFAGGGRAVMSKTNEQIAMSVSKNTLAVNVFLSVLKLFIGLFANSTALIAEAANSISDVLSTIIVIIGVKLAGKKSDKDHPYGHERMECAAALILSAMVFATGLMIGYSGVQKVIAGSIGELAVPGGIALIAVIVTMAIKESLYWYTRAAAKKTGSSVLKAFAWDHRSDVLSATGAFIGILGARIGLPVLDPIAGVIICLLILKVAVDIFRDAMSKMTDTSCDETFEDEIRNLALEQRDVLGVDRLKTRLFGDKIYIDIEICADGALSLHEAHTTAQRVHDAIETRYERVKHCMVHVNPVEDPRR